MANGKSKATGEGKVDEKPQERRRARRGGDQNRGTPSDPCDQNRGTPSAQLVFGAWGVLGGVFRSSWEPLAAVLGPSWAHHGASWEHLESILGHLGASWERLAVFFRTSGRVSRASWDAFGLVNGASYPGFNFWINF